MFLSRTPPNSHPLFYTFLSTSLLTCCLTSRCSSTSCLFFPLHPSSFMLFSFLFVSCLISFTLSTSFAPPLLCLFTHTFQPPVYLQSFRTFLHLQIHFCSLPHPPLLCVTLSFPSLPPFPSLFLPSSIAPHLSGRLAPPHLPTTSAALPCQTVPTSPEGWASAAHSMQASSGVPGTSRAPPTLAGPLPRRCHMATARPGGHTAPQGFSASSHPSLYAGE